MNRLIDKINKDMLYYEATKKQIEIWLDIINEEFNTLTNYNPINHIKTRIKTAESILGKLKKKNLEISYENIFKLDDIVGARIVCDFVDNIYEIVSKLKNNSNINIIGENRLLTRLSKILYFEIRFNGFVSISSLLFFIFDFSHLII